MGNRFVSRRQSNFAQWVNRCINASNIAVRAYLGLSTADKSEIGLIVEDYLLGSLE